MSRIGKKPIDIPSGVTISVDKSNVVTVKGPKGEMSQQVDQDLEIKVEDSQLTVSRPTDQKRHRAAHGLYRQLINNMTVGVSEGFKKEMEVVGVGYKAEAKGQLLEMNLGFSHPVLMIIPKAVTVTTETKKGFPPLITLESFDKQLLGHIAAKIRSLRPPEPYKGKGIKFKGEILRRKAGKAAAAK